MSENIRTRHRSVVTGHRKRFPKSWKKNAGNRKPGVSRLLSAGKRQRNMWKKYRRIISRIPRRRIT
jgi:hypothetical protein